MYAPSASATPAKTVTAWLEKHDLANRRPWLPAEDRFLIVQHAVLQRANDPAATAAGRSAWLHLMCRAERAPADGATEERWRALQNFLPLRSTQGIRGRFYNNLRNAPRVVAELRTLEALPVRPLARSR